jgi:hypothetical protein
MFRAIALDTDCEVCRKPSDSWTLFSLRRSNCEMTFFVQSTYFGNRFRQRNKRHLAQEVIYYKSIWEAKDRKILAFYS